MNSALSLRLDHYKTENVLDVTSKTIANTLKWNSSHKFLLIQSISSKNKTQLNFRQSTMRHHKYLLSLLPVNKDSEAIHYITSEYSCSLLKPSSGFSGTFSDCTFCPHHGRLARWRACDVAEAKEGLENELWRRWSNRSVGEWTVT